MSEPDQSCWKCQGDVSEGDSFCRHCGIDEPAGAVTWDWKEQPCFGSINSKLKPYGVEIVELETGTDQHAIRVRKIEKKRR